MEKENGQENNCKTTERRKQILKCKNIFTKMLKDVGIEVAKSIETRSKCSLHAGKGSIQQS